MNADVGHIQEGSRVHQMQPVCPHRFVGWVCLLGLFVSCRSPTPTQRTTPVITDDSFRHTTVEDQDSPVAAVPSWMVGGVPVGSNATGYHGAAVVERLSFDGRSHPTPLLSGDVDQEFRGVVAGYTFGRWGIETRMGHASLSDGANTADGISGGARAALRIGEAGRVAFGVDGSIEVGAVDFVAGTSDIDIRWVHSDWRLGAAFMPSPDVDYYLAPFGGVGLRYLDGVQRLSASVYEELDRTLPFAYLGAAFAYRLSDSVQVGIEAQVLVGDLQGGVLSAVVSF